MDRKVTSESKKPRQIAVCITTVICLGFFDSDVNMEKCAFDYNLHFIKEKKNCKNFEVFSNLSAWWQNL